MTNDEILQVAREVALIGSNDKGIYGHALITFARRIAAMQREIDAGICTEYAASLDNDYNRKYGIVAEIQEPYFECAEQIRSMK